MNLFKDTRQLTRSVWIVFALLAAVLLAFSGTYYWDRYAHPGDRSPLEVGIQELEAEVRANPTQPGPRLALAEYYLKNKQYAPALEQAQQVLSAYPENDRALFAAGMAHALSEQHEQALPLLEQFAVLHRQSPTANSDLALQTALYYLGVSYLKLERPAEAVQVLSEAVAINDADADTLYQLGLANLRSGEHRLALDNFERAVMFVPDYAEVYAGMAECYSALQMPDYVIYTRGMLAFAKEDYRQAKSDLQLAVQRLPQFAPAHLGLGLALEQLGELAAAQASLEHAVQLDASSFLANTALQRVQMANNP